MRNKVDLTKVKNPFVKQIIMENTRPDFEMACARVRLDCKAPKPTDEVDINGMCKPTDLDFRVRFCPTLTSYGGKFKTAKPFMLKCNMILPKGIIRLHGYEDMMESKNEVLIWLRENTHVCKATFDTAVNNPYMWVPFSLDYRKYKRKTGTWCMTDYAINNPWEDRKNDPERVSKK